MYVLKILNSVMDEFIDVLPIPCDKEPTYISFEVTSKEDRLKEAKQKNANLTRGLNYTSIDAFIYAKHKSGKLWLIPIEWKYTEYYNNQDKSIEDRDGGEKGNKEKGEERVRRYSDLITKSWQLKSMDNYQSSIYFFEPFYQLMRQTLWAEQVLAHKDDEKLKADDYLHIHIIPKNNRDLFQKRRGYKLTGKGMEESWRECLNDQSKYVIVDPKDFLSPISETNASLYKYLNERYW